MNKLSKQSAARIIASKKTIVEPGVYDCTVTNVHPYVREKDGLRQVAIINFAAKSDYHRQAAKQLMDQGDYDDAANQNMSMSVFEGSKIPENGQAVEITVIKKTTRNGITGLFIKSWAPAPKKVAEIDDVSFYMDETENFPQAVKEQASPFSKADVGVDA